MNHLITFAGLFLLMSVQPIMASETDNCRQCHIQIVDEWRTSQHARSMLPATPDNVLGNFSHVRFFSEDVEAKFYRQSDRYHVRLTESGQTSNWTVRYTFGIYPLQQYLIDTGDGKLQALNIAWDSRSVDAGGQRWFRLDAAEHQRPDNPLHWRGVYQNWNGMCADCHSTAFRKGYIPDTDRYESHFEQINVSCSACHARANTHAQAARSGESQSAGADLSARGAWLTGTLEHKPQHTGPLTSTKQVETCGRCHSLRTRLDQSPAGGLNNHYSLTRLQSPLYYADGRVREEVFVLGSFLQSKMHEAGVVCSNCHNPHSGKLLLAGNALCSQCHAAPSFDQPHHHHHPQGSPGAQCVSCHMPETTYMQIDPRREHNFTTPNPVTSRQSDSPDPCLACHNDQNREWSIQQMSFLWPEHRERSDWFEIQQADLPTMVRFIADQQQVALYRASLLEQQAGTIGRVAPKIILQQLQSPDPLMRESSWKAATNLQPSDLHGQAMIGLQDTHLSVRLAAFEALMLAGALPSKPTRVRAEYEAYLQQQSDRPAGRTLIGRYARISGDSAVAEQHFKIALEMDNAYLPAYILLTDLLRNQQRFVDAIASLNNGLDQLPENSSLWHLRGLTWLQLKKHEEALGDLGKAARLAPDNWLFSYRYALVSLRLGHIEQAQQAAVTLSEIAPDNPQVKALLKEIQAKKQNKPL